MIEQTVALHMTRGAHTIGIDQSLAVAHRFMREHHIRHLPVLDHGELVGIVSQRDLYFIETLRDVDPDSLTVSEAMTPSPYVVPLSAPLEEVARTMAERRYGSAVVMDRGDVVGVFTTVDALRALAGLLEGRRRRREARARAPREAAHEDRADPLPR